MLAPLFTPPPLEDRHPETGSYMTDGTHLYRRLESPAWRDVVAVEDCHSLEIVLLPARDARHLRRVSVAVEAAA